MAYLRHATRHIQQTLSDHVKDWMTGLGWLGPPNIVPFGTTPANYQIGRMDETEVATVSGNLISASFGEEPDVTEWQMGGGLLMQEHVMFVDCLSETDAVALAMACDIKDMLQGLAPDTTRFSPLYDYTATPRQPVPGYQFEFVEVARRKPDVGYRQNWHVVYLTAQLTYGEPS